MNTLLGNKLDAYDGIFVTNVAKQSMSKHRLLQYTTYQKRAKLYKGKSFKEVLLELALQRNV